MFVFMVVDDNQPPLGLKLENKVINASRVSTMASCCRWLGLDVKERVDAFCDMHGDGSALFWQKIIEELTIVFWSSQS